MERERQRDKLIELIVNAKQADPETGSFTEFLADFLMGYGVFVPDDNYNLSCLRELAQADKDGKCIVFSEGFGTVKSYNPNEIEGAYVLDACGVISKEEYEYQTGLKGEQP